jgi:hypothetical protein
MRRNRFLGHALWLRGLTLAGIVTMGLISIVGSGGGVGMPSDCPPGLDCSAPPPQPAANVRPPYVTALVGTPVTFSAETSNISGGLTYQWSRSSDGGATFVDIAGATGKTYTLASVNLGDDGAVFQVAVWGLNAFVRPQGSRLAVSATPGLVLQDGEFQAADWLATPFPIPNAPAPAHTEERVATGGNPGAFRKMVFQIPPQSLAARVFYTSLVATYDPQRQGAIYVIDYSEDGISLQDNTSTTTDSAMLLEQGGRRYVANLRSSSDYLPTSWSAVASQSSLRAMDFNLIDGPECLTGESCPDFSALGLPMRFGYWRISFGVQGDSIAHGIDNWKVTVWSK